MSVRLPNDETTAAVLAFTEVLVSASGYEDTQKYPLFLEINSVSVIVVCLARVTDV